MSWDLTLYDHWCQTKGDKNISGGNSTAETKFGWRIKEFSERPEQKGSSIRSDVFTAISIHGVPTDWYLEVYPNGTESAKPGFLSVVVALNSNEIEIEAFYYFYFVNNDGEEVEIVPDNDTECYTRRGSGWEFHDALPLNDKYWLLEDSLAIVCKIVVDYVFTIPKYVADQGQKMLEDLEEAYALKKPLGLDVTVTCKDKSFECSKFMLTARSKVFNSMFQSNMKESQTNIVVIEDLKPSVVAEMLHYIHTGKVPKIDENAQELLAAADRYQLEDLKRSCEENLISTLKDQNMFDILILSDVYSAARLKKKAIKFVTENLSSTSSDWRKELAEYPSLWPDIVESLLNLNSELKKFAPEHFTSDFD